MLQTFLQHSHRWAQLLVATALLVYPSTTTAQTNLDDDDRPPYTPGLVAKVRSSTTHNLTRLVPDVSLHELHLPESLTAASGQAARAENAVTWKGYLWARDNGIFRLHLFVAGKVQVSLAGKLLLDARSDKPQWLECEPIELSFGYHPLHIEFQPTNTSAQLGLYWSGPAFSLEPISSDFLFHATSESPQDHFQLGQMLDRSLRCAACHRRSPALSQTALATKSDGTENAATGHLPAPALTKLQGNLRPQWLVQQLTQPASGPFPQADASSAAESAAAPDLHPSRSAKASNQHLPAFEMATADAEDIVAALWRASLPPEESVTPEQQLHQANQTRPKKSPKLRTVGDAAQGRLTFVSIGCLACHQVGELGVSSELERQLFGGGDLSEIHHKRTGDFIGRWLDDPARVNTDHRMPDFELTPLEQLDLAAYLSSLADSSELPLSHESSDHTNAQDAVDTEKISGDADRGAELITAHRCGSCHQLPQGLAAPLVLSKEVSTPLNNTGWDAGSLTAASRWDDGCMQDARPAEHRPGFGLNSSQRAALQAYWSEPTPWALGSDSSVELLRENNCTACHARDSHPGIKQQLPKIATAVPELASRLSALAPPSLTAIGDKLYEPALRASITRTSPPLRPWLDVRMPRFKLSETQLESLTRSLIAHDRIPARPDSADADAVPRNAIKPNEIAAPASPNSVTNKAAMDATDSLLADTAHQLAAARLVTAEGFGCQSCHAIGAVAAPKVDLNARGTNLAMLGERIRPSWFQRWVRNPSRIVPRMEMPAIQTPVHGVLQDSLDLQLEALWAVLNTPDFSPPRPGPIRVVRTHNTAELQERAWLLTNVLEIAPKTFIRPLVVGLPNRHNFLFDLEAGRLSTWWLGDTAHQHTRGKTWFWEPGVSTLTQPEQVLESVRVIDSAGRTWQPTPLGQFATQFDRSEHVDNSIVWHGRLHLTLVEMSQSGDSQAALPTRWLNIAQTLAAVEFGPSASSACTTRLTGLEPGDRVQWHSSATAVAAPTEKAGKWSSALQIGETRIEVSSHNSMQPNAQGLFDFLVTDPGDTASDTSTGLTVQWTSTYRALVPTDRFPQTISTDTKLAAQYLDVVPGYSGVQLPLPAKEMPISFAWDAAGDCYIGSLKGRVLRLRDGDGDGLADHYELISDELPTPYGLWAGAEGIDALSKFGLVRLTPPRKPGDPFDATIIADGWGSTEDYHDWAVGLERDADGNYYMVLPCQQDDRPPAAAHLRGTALKLIPQHSSQTPRRYRIEVLSAGLRFPMGIALHRDGELFATDNQGNYNPFNELNHLRAGKRYGFINKIENQEGFSPEFETPAINLPHPWTRSVNGVCFLQTPEKLPQQSPVFGPFEGHLIGCEMNGRFLVRMSLQKVGGEYQGATYLFSRPPGDASAGAPLQIGQDASGASAKNFEGPIVCEVSPTGELYVGSLLDSGWGGGQNTGSIVRLTPSGELPLGIAEVRATAKGFEVDFTQPVDTDKATTVENYQLRSYQRISTPAYGGDDQDERHESIAHATLSEDRKRVTLELSELRAGFVYELNIAALGTDSQSLFPSQAHYTMRNVPK